MTLVEMLVGLGVATVVMAALFPSFLNLWRMQQTSFGMPGVQDDAREAAITVAQALRSATLCTSNDGAGCTLNAAAESASSNGVTVYRRNDDGTLSEIVYSTSSGNLTAQSSGPATTLYPNATLALTFYGSATYNSSSLSPYTPTNATLTNLAAVGIVATVARNGLTGTYSTLIRLRNSPMAP